MSFDRIVKIYRKEISGSGTKTDFCVQLEVNDLITDVEISASKLLSYSHFQKFVLEKKGILFRLRHLESALQREKTRLWLDAVQRALSANENQNQ